VSGRGQVRPSDAGPHNIDGRIHRLPAGPARWMAYQGPVRVLQPRRTTTTQIVIVIVLEPEMASNKSAQTADAKALHCPTRVQQRTSILTFCLTSC